MPDTRILCIDDEPHMIELFRLILEPHGYEVIGAQSVQAGLDAVGVDKPNLILLDLIMPDLDGEDVFHQLRQDARLGDVPVIVVTAKAAPIDKALWVNIAKVDDYVTKPFRTSELVGRIERVLARRQARDPGTT